MKVPSHINQLFNRHGGNSNTSLLYKLHPVTGSAYQTPTRTSGTGRIREANEERTIERCVYEDCGKRQKITLDSTAIVRFQVGLILYNDADSSIEFTSPDWMKFHGDKKVVYAHSVCAVEGGLELIEMETDKCSICKEQFFCLRPPEETAILVTLGHFKTVSALRPGASFIENVHGSFHWPCADHVWQSALFEGLFG